MIKRGISCMSFMLLTALVYAQKADNIEAAVKAIESKCVNWRRSIHQYPELSNREFKTAKFVTAHLKSLGLEVLENVAHTGVVGLLKTGRPGPVIALRADMDALPVTERTILLYASKEKGSYQGQEVGVMHACGHDAHVAILMSVAEVLTNFRNKLSGTIKFIFQPAEEGPPEGEEGGAPLMVKEGVLQNPKVDAMFGLHINAQTPVGQIKYREGGMMAASDWFTIKIQGKQTHGAQPWLGIDPVYVGAQIINGLQAIISRQTELTKNAAVISTTMFKGGVRENIIPEEAVIGGTIRTLDKKMQEDIKSRITQTATHIAAASGAKAIVSFDGKTSVVYNDPVLTSKILPSLKKAAGGNVIEMNAVTGAEDFSAFAEKVPSVFFYLGGMPATMKPENSAAHHTPDFSIDEAGMLTGIKAFCYIVIDYLNGGKEK
ncbi:MAG TPA: amidohydrolase [Chitinophagaceae bacterium]|nr:amidohydrolase [Chitinophagaceae bacterium]